MAKSTRSTSSSTPSGTTPSGGGGGTGAAGGFNPALIIPAVIPFALPPGQANMAVLIDYTSTTGNKLFNSAILKLPDILYGESKSINLFNKKLAERAKQSGWMEAGENSIMIPDSTGTPRNLITE